jgi:hypothetical protein
LRPQQGGDTRELGHVRRDRRVCKAAEPFAVAQASRGAVDDNVDNDLGQADALIVRAVVVAVITVVSDAAVVNVTKREVSRDGRDDGWTDPVLDRLWVAIAGDSGDFHGSVILGVEVAAVVWINVTFPGGPKAAGLNATGR